MQFICFLGINLNDNLKSAIRDARSNYKAICDSLDVNYLIFDGIGKDICKKNAVSPDAVMQLGFQVSESKKNKNKYNILILGGISQINK